MPKLKQFAGCRIAIYPRDHRPPHVHVEFRDGSRCTVEIESLRVRARFGQPPGLRRCWRGSRRTKRCCWQPGWRSCNEQAAPDPYVKAQSPTTLTITWSTGETLPVDVSRPIRRFKLYAPLPIPHVVALACEALSARWAAKAA